MFEEIIAHAQEGKSAAYWLMFAELALLALMFLLSYVIFSMLTARRQQSNAIRKIMVSVAEDHNLHDDVEQITQDDLGEIAIALNRTLAELRKDFAAIQQHASEIASASTETAATTEQTNVNIAAERDSVGASRKSAEALNSSIEEDIISIGKVNDTAGQARQIASDGAANVANAVSGIRTTATEVQNVGTIMSELNARVEDILGMVDVIRSVAEQTNLLALNAAIEAARAGEQGRGFAVVADEVRALAQRTQESTEQISKVVDELTSSSNRAIQSVEQGNLQATEAVTMAEQINQTLDSMVASMVTLDEVAKDVLSSAQSQQSAVAAMTDEMRNIDVMSEENANGAQHISAAASQLSNIADEMLRQTKRYQV